MVDVWTLNRDRDHVFEGGKSDVFALSDHNIKFGPLVADFRVVDRVSPNSETTARAKIGTVYTVHGPITEAAHLQNIVSNTQSRTRDERVVIAAQIQLRH